MDIQNALKDKFMIKECNEMTRKLLKAKMDINTICAIIKEYQTKYLYIKSEGGEELAKTFTMEMWWRTRVNK